MPYRWKFWRRFKFASRKPRIEDAPLFFELDEFARLLSSRDATALKQLAAGLSRCAEAQIRTQKA
jgi:hypothetical protein